MLIFVLFNIRCIIYPLLQLLNLIPKVKFIAFNRQKSGLKKRTFNTIMTSCYHFPAKLDVELIQGNRNFHTTHQSKR